MTDIWYREYLAVAAQLDAMTAERDDLLQRQRAYETIMVARNMENDKLRAELAAEREQLRLTNIDWFTAEAKNDELRELLRESRNEIQDIRNDLTFAPTMQDRLDALNARIDAALGGEDGDS